VPPNPRRLQKEVLGANRCIFGDDWRGKATIDDSSKNTGKRSGILTANPKGVSDVQPC
jgi:hypothetical protein